MRDAGEGVADADDALRLVAVHELEAEVLGGGDERLFVGRRRRELHFPLGLLEEDRMVEGEVEDERARRLAPAAVALG